MSKKELSVVVNERDKIINYQNKELCHSNRILHRAVHVVVFDSKKNIFVQKRSKKKETFPSYFEASLSGHLIKGETYSKAALRELKEELGIKIDPYKLKRLEKIRVRKHQENEILQLYFINNIDKIKIDKKEVASGKFMLFNDVLKD